MMWIRYSRVNRIRAFRTRYTVWKYRTEMRKALKYGISVSWYTAVCIDSCINNTRWIIFNAFCSHIRIYGAAIQKTLRLCIKKLDSIAKKSLEKWIQTTSIIHMAWISADFGVGNTVTWVRGENRFYPPKNGSGGILANRPPAGYPLRPPGSGYARDSYGSAATAPAPVARNLLCVT